MSVTTNDRTNDKIIIDATPKAMVRIAIPSFKIGWRKTKKRSSKPSGPSREEYQNLFQDEFRRSANSDVALTQDERLDYNQALSLRSALYGPKKRGPNKH